MSNATPSTKHNHKPLFPNLADAGEAAVASGGRGEVAAVGAEVTAALVMVAGDAVTPSPWILTPAAVRSSVGSGHVTTWVRVAHLSQTTVEVTKLGGRSGRVHVDGSPTHVSMMVHIAAHTGVGQVGQTAVAM